MYPLDIQYYGRMIKIPALRCNKNPYSCKCDFLVTPVNSANCTSWILGCRDLHSLSISERRPIASWVADLTFFSLRLDVNTFFGMSFLTLQWNFVASIRLGTNISPSKGTIEDDFPFPKVGYVSSLEGILWFKRCMSENPKNFHHMNDPLNSPLSLPVWCWGWIWFIGPFRSEETHTAKDRGHIQVPCRYPRNPVIFSDDD